MRRCFNYRTIRQLMLFAAVTQEKSFRRAAKRLYLQFLLNQQIKRKLKLWCLECTYNS